MKQWEENAKAVEELYGSFVNWEDRFYLCPECEEPVYECDWSNEELKEFLCPICEFGENQDEYWSAYLEGRECEL